MDITWKNLSTPHFALIKNEQNDSWSPSTGRRWGPAHLLLSRFNEHFVNYSAGLMGLSSGHDIKSHSSLELKVYVQYVKLIWPLKSTRIIITLIEPWFTYHAVVTVVVVKVWPATSLALATRGCKDCWEAFGENGPRNTNPITEEYSQVLIC